MTSNIFSLIRRKTLSLIRNLYEVARRQFSKQAKILLTGLAVEFLISSLRPVFFPGFVPGVASLGAMVAVLAASFKLAFFRKEKSDVPDAYRNLIPKQ